MYALIRTCALNDIGPRAYLNYALTHIAEPSSGSLSWPRTPAAFPGGQQRLAQLKGDPYLRTWLIHGARAVVRMCQGIQRRGSTAIDPCLENLLARKHPNQAAVAQANRSARIAWALLAGNRVYRSPVTAA